MTVYRHRDDLAHVDSPERVAMLDLRRLEQPPVILEGSAALIWLAVDGSRDEAAVVEHVAEQVGLPAADIAADVRDFLARLVERDLVVARAEDAGCRS